VAYFGALLTRTAGGWEAREVDLDEFEDLGAVTDIMRESADDDTALLLLEQEDTWFAVVRVDGEEDPRVFVSDATAAARSAYGDMLLVAALPGLDQQGEPVESPLGSDDIDDDFGDDDEEDDDDTAAASTGPAGDADILDDFALTPERLVALATGDILPAEALAEVAEALGAADQLEAVR
jgi:putative tRNA adenosine deaminase-associated protein